MLVRDGFQRQSFCKGFFFLFSFQSLIRVGIGRGNSNIIWSSVSFGENTPGKLKPGIFREPSNYIVLIWNTSYFLLFFRISVIMNSGDHPRAKNVWSFWTGTVP